jgi:hypothetical protein
MVVLVTQQQDLNSTVVMVLHFIEQCNCKSSQGAAAATTSRNINIASITDVSYVIQVCLLMNILHLNPKIGMRPMPFMVLETSQKLCNMIQIILNFVASLLAEDDDIHMCFTFSSLVYIFKTTTVAMYGAYFT